MGTSLRAPWLRYGGGGGGGFASWFVQHGSGVKLDTSLRIDPSRWLMSMKGTAAWIPDGGSGVGNCSHGRH